MSTEAIGLIAFGVVGCTVIISMVVLTIKLYK